MLVALAVALSALTVFCQNKKSENPSPRPGDTQSHVESYESWLSPYKSGSLSGDFENSHQIRMVITILRGDDLEPDPKTASFWGEGYRIITTRFAVSNEGTVSMTRYTASATQGGGPSKLKDEDFRRLGTLISELPDDESRLPPKGRRLVVQVANQTSILARVYDKANLPESVLEMLRILGADTWPIFPFPDFQPMQRWEHGDFKRANLDFDKTLLEEGESRVLATSPDRRLTVVGQLGDSTVHVEKLSKAKEEPYNPNGVTVLRINDSKTGSTIHEMREPMNGRSYVYMYAARFTPDGRHLLVMSSVPDVRIYDVVSGQKLNRLPLVPNGAVAYYPSSNWKYGVAALRTGEIKLMEARSGRTLAQIDFGDQLQSVSYSPDDSEVAVVTVGHDPDGSYRCHLRIWRTSTGDMLHELRPLEATPRDGFGEPVWMPDGKYLLSLTREGHFAGPSVVGIWNTKSGRYRGALAGCMHLDSPLTRFLLLGNYLYKTCSSDVVLMWDVQSALRKIADFEKSLPN